ncbi:hypothetical protein [Streptomyces sp. NPDC001165]|uniref:hypothetical protein n=1 Tax=Streptomyces sp. NPDC001165 TaxID=3364546 RepID=UPI0036A8F8A9
MSSATVTWALSTLARQGLTPLGAEKARGFTETGFIVEEADKPDAARVTVTARFTGQDKYDHWGESHKLANRLMGVLEENGAGFEEIEGHEPNCVFDVFPPADRAAEK